MKKSIIMATIMGLSVSLFAQYKEMWFNHSTTTNNRYEWFEDGLRTQQNYYSSSKKAYLAGVGVSVDSNLQALGPDRVRFVLQNENASGAPFVNKAYEFTTLLGTKFSAGASSLAEISNSAGTGGYKVAGYIKSYGTNVVAGGSDALLFNLSNAGTVANSIRIDFSGGYDVATCIKRSIYSPNRWIVCGTSKFAGYQDVWVMKIQLNGGIDWVVRFNVDPTKALIRGTAAANYLVEDSITGDIFVAGSVKDNYALASTEGMIAKLNSLGYILSAHKYSDPVVAGNVEFHSIKKSIDGNYVIGGFSSENGGAVSNDMLICKIDPACNLMYDNLLRVNSSGVNIASKAYDIMERLNTSGNLEYYLSGATTNATGVNQNHVIYKTDDLGGGIGLENYVYRSLGVNVKGFGIDMVPNGASNPGIISFTSVANAPTRGSRTDMYYGRYYFNGCTCFGCPNNSKVDIGVNMRKDTAFTAARDLTTKDTLKATIINCLYGVICDSATKSAGSNLRLIQEDDEMEAGELGTKSMQFGAYPNPAPEEIITIQFSGEGKHDFQLILQGIDGRMVRESESWNVEGEGYRVMDIGHLSPGMYYVRVLESGKNINVLRFIKK